MFKRANKITSLLVAAAAVASMVPAYAADVKKIESQDGKVYNAIAYKDGQGYVDAEINGKDEATYYLSGGKYNTLSDIETGSDVTAYGTKYAEVNDGDYFVDLTNGKVTDENLADNARDDAASNLRKKVKADTDGRYLKDGSTYAADSFQNNWTASNEIPGTKFGDVWYSTILSNKDNTNGFTNSGNALNVYTDANGNYIDADYNLGKIKVTTGTTTTANLKTVYIDNTHDTYDAYNKSNAVSAFVRNAKVLTQDKDYIYRKVDVSVSVTAPGVKVVEIGGQSVDSNNSAFSSANGDQTVTFEAIQKISKAQSSGTIGGVKYAKTVTTYVISDDKGILSGDANSFIGYIADPAAQFTAANGKLTAYKVDASNQVDAQTTTLKSNNGLYYTDLSGAKTGQDLQDTSTTSYEVQVDADGNLWRLDGGYIYEWDNDSDWNKVYKVDGSFNKMSVYNKDNIVAWNQDDEVYTVIGGKTTTKDTDATGATTDTTTTAAAGWVKNTDGTWSYNKAGVKATGWLQDGATWYYLNANGIMQTGWQNVGGTWYFLNASGAMQTGWQNVGGTWYFLNASGAMQTGWINDNGTWYYCNASGAMLANTVVDGYVLGSNGAWVK